VGREIERKSPEPVAEIHPETASRLGIHEGDRVIIATKQGQITQTAHLTERVHPDVINASYGWWFPEEDITSQDNWTKSNFNILTSVDKVGKEFGTPNLKGICCRVQKYPA
jgi:anaerobic selenocysteine-containing dehydrogenase